MGTVNGGVGIKGGGAVGVEIMELGLVMGLGLCEVGVKFWTGLRGGLVASRVGIKVVKIRDWV